MKKVTKKLELNRKTISNLTNSNLQEINGGDIKIVPISGNACGETEICRDPDPIQNCFTLLYCVEIWFL